MIRIDKIRSVIVFVAIFLFSAEKTLAAFTMNINSIDPPSISTNEQEVTVTASISGLPNPSFFRIAWQKASGDTYFGYVKNNSGDWVKIETDRDCRNYYSVSDVNTNSLTLIAKIGDDNNPVNGSFTMKLRRYTATCGSNSDSAPFPVEINLPTPTPTQTPTPTPAPTNSPTPAPPATPTTSPTKSPVPRPTATPTPLILGSETDNPQVDILALGDSLKTPSPTPAQTSKKSNLAFPIIAGIFTASGLALVGAAFFLAYKKQKENPSDTISE